MNQFKFDEAMLALIFQALCEHDTMTSMSDRYTKISYLIGVLFI